MIADSALRPAPATMPGAAPDGRAAPGEPAFALTFDAEAVHLMERESGEWSWRGAARFDADDLPGRMAALHRLLPPEAGSSVALIIPDDQILYTALEVEPGLPRAEAVRRAMEGLTPYGMDELALDWREEGPGRVKVAAVWRQTLAEAEGFAMRNGFAPAAVLADTEGRELPGGVRFDGVAHEDVAGWDVAGWQGANAPAEADGDGVQRLAVELARTRPEAGGGEVASAHARHGVAAEQDAGSAGAGEGALTDGNATPDKEGGDLTAVKAPGPDAGGEPAVERSASPGGEAEAAPVAWKDGTGIMSDQLSHEEGEDPPAATGNSETAARRSGDGATEDSGGAPAATQGEAADGKPAVPGDEATPGTDGLAASIARIRALSRRASPAASEPRAIPEGSASAAFADDKREDQRGLARGRAEVLRRQAERRAAPPGDGATLQPVPGADARAAEGVRPGLPAPSRATPARRRGPVASAGAGVLSPAATGEAAAAGSEGGTAQAGAASLTPVAGDQAPAPGAAVPATPPPEVGATAAVAEEHAGTSGRPPVAPVRPAGSRAEAVPLAAMPGRERADRRPRGHGGLAVMLALLAAGLLAVFLLGGEGEPPVATADAVATEAAPVPSAQSGEGEQLAATDAADAAPAVPVVAADAEPPAPRSEAGTMDEAPPSAEGVEAPAGTAPVRTATDNAAPPQPAPAASVPPPSRPEPAAAPVVAAPAPQISAGSGAAAPAEPPAPPAGGAATPAAGPAAPVAPATASIPPVPAQVSTPVPPSTMPPTLSPPSAGVFPPASVIATSPAPVARPSAIESAIAEAVAEVPAAPAPAAASAPSEADAPAGAPEASPAPPPVAPASPAPASPAPASPAPAPSAAPADRLAATSSRPVPRPARPATEPTLQAAPASADETPPAALPERPTGSASQAPSGPAEASAPAARPAAAGTGSAQGGTPAPAPRPSATAPPASTGAAGPAASPRPVPRPRLLPQEEASLPPAAPLPDHAAHLPAPRLRLALAGDFLPVAAAELRLFGAMPAPAAREAVRVHGPAGAALLRVAEGAPLQRVAQARPPRRDAGGASSPGRSDAVEAALDAAVGETAPVAAPASPGPMRLSSRPQRRPGGAVAAGSGGLLSPEAVEGAIAAAIEESPAPPGGVALSALRSSPLPPRAPALRAGDAAAPDAAAEAAAAAVAAVAPVPPAPPPAVDSAALAAQAERLRLDEELQAAVEARIRARAAADARLDAEQRAAAEARARAQAAAEERAAAARRQPVRPVEVDEEPELAAAAPRGGGATIGTVAANATHARGMDLSRTMLIGVIGAGPASRGLIRLRNGRIVTVRLGDRIDGGTITSIGNSRVTYVRGGRPFELRVLDGR